MPDKETDFHYGFVTGVLVVLLAMWWLHRRRKKERKESIGQGPATVQSVNAPGVVSGPAPVEVHVAPTSV